MFELGPPDFEMGNCVQTFQLANLLEKKTSNEATRNIIDDQEWLEME